MLHFHPQSKLVIVDYFGLHDPEDEDTMLRRNIGKYSPFGTMSHPGWPFSSALQRGPQISQFANVKVMVEDNFSLVVYSLTSVAQAVLLRGFNNSPWRIKCWRP
jgi:hypothetical protein